MLKLRVLTSVLMAPIILWILLGAPAVAWSAFLGVVVLLGAWEWTTLMQWRSPVARMAYVILLTVMLLVSGLFLERGATWVMGVLVVALLFWCWALLEIVFGKDIRNGILTSSAFRPLGGLLVLYPAWLALGLLRLEPRGEWLTFYFLFLVWGADVGAYFAGHRFGRHKLAPSVSPGKTWEGVGGGVLLALLVSVVAGYVGLHQSGQQIAVWLMIAILTAFVSVLGDLHESRMKRIVGVKDSGTLIPGHGGMLDRIDALTSAAPFFVFFSLAGTALARAGG